ncbi:hypothetical protein CSX12_11395 [Microbacterium sp. Y-01]|nr:hypothetical protein CSX12_11395 [Microbacterium sp. Y-01]
MSQLLADAGAGWWLSGGVALDHWIGAPIRTRLHADASTTASALPLLIGALPAGLSAWMEDAEGGPLVRWRDRDGRAGAGQVRIRDDATGEWVLRIHVEDGTDGTWMYRRDPRLQLPWDRAVQSIAGVPTGAPEVQLVWKALRPRPEDDLDRDAVLHRLSADARSWFERAILSVHPHSSWSIHVRTPFTAAKASWNRPRR